MKQRMRPHNRHNLQGASLIVSLVMLAAIMLLGASAAYIALLGEKASRNDRDRQIAFQAAEAALMDAELDIEHSPDPARSRSHIFSQDSATGFPDEGSGVCRSGQDTIHWGLCGQSSKDKKPVWLLVDFFDTDPLNSRSIPYGAFTGQSFQTGKGSLPSRLPRYVIEVMTYRRPGYSAGKPSYLYRITAIGFGARDNTQVVLQTIYRKESMGN